MKILRENAREDVVVEFCYKCSGPQLVPRYRNSLQIAWLKAGQIAEMLAWQGF